MKVWFIRIVILLVCWAGSAVAQTVQLDATLILASDDPAPLDRRLERVEYQLRPLFRFEYYRFLGEGSGALAMPGETSIAMGNGHFLNIKASSGGDRVRAEVRWLRGDQPLLTTAVNLRKGKPVILGGVSEGSGKLIVTLTARE